MKDKDKFKLNDVTIVMDIIEDSKDTHFNVHATDIKSPLYYPYCSKEEAATMFAKWLENTLAAMSSNDAECLILNCKWL